MYYYQFNIGDYVKQTVHLTPMEDICYRRLIDMYYETEQPIPKETDRVSRRLRLDTELVDSVLSEFFTLAENGWVNDRCEAEISAYHVKANTARSNGKLGGRPKKTQSVSNRNPTGTQHEPKRKLTKNHKPITNNHKPVQNPAPAKAAVFCFKTALTDAGGMPDLVADWLKVRAKLKAANTKTAFNLFMREVERAGYTVNQALEVCCSRSWKGFDADWVKGSKPAEQETPKLDTSLESRRTGLQAQADESYQTRQWLDGERKYRTIITIENGQIVRTKHYDDRGIAA